MPLSGPNGLPMSILAALAVEEAVWAA